MLAFEKKYFIRLLTLMRLQNLHKDRQGETDRNRQRQTGSEREIHRERQRDRDSERVEFEVSMKALKIVEQSPTTTSRMQTNQISVCLELPTFNENWSLCIVPLLFSTSQLTPLEQGFMVCIVREFGSILVVVALVVGTWRASFFFQQNRWTEGDRSLLLLLFWLKLKWIKWCGG